RGSGRHATEHVVGDLKHHKEGRNIDSGHGGELHRSQIQRRAVKGEQRGPDEKDTGPGASGWLMNGDPNDSIASRFTNSGRQHEEKGCHLARQLSATSSSTTGPVPG